MGNDNVHAGIKSMYVRLGLLGDYSALLTGRSNAGLTEPGQNTAITLARLSALVCMSNPNFDHLVIGGMMVILQREIPQSFYDAEKRLRRDDKKWASSGKFVGDGEPQRAVSPRNRPNFRHVESNDLC